MVNIIYGPFTSSIAMFRCKTLYMVRLHLVLLCLDVKHYIWSVFIWYCYV